MSEYFERFGKPVTRVPVSARNDRKVKVRLSSTSPWRATNMPYIPIDEMTYSERCKLVKQMLTHDKSFMDMIAENTGAVYAVVELHKNRMVVKLLSEKVVQYPMNDQLSSRGEDLDKYVFLRFNVPHRIAVIVEGDEARAKVIDLYCDQIFDRVLTSKDFSIAATHAILQDM